MTKGKLATAAAIGLVALLIGISWDYFNRDSVPHQAVRLHLQLTASSIYEFYNATGRWPTATDDLALTSLPQRSPYWRTLIEDGSVAARRAGRKERKRYEVK